MYFPPLFTSHVRDVYMWSSCSVGVRGIQRSLPGNRAGMEDGCLCKNNVCKDIEKMYAKCTSPCMSYTRSLTTLKSILQFFVLRKLPTEEYNSLVRLLVHIIKFVLELVLCAFFRKMSKNCKICFLPGVYLQRNNLLAVFHTMSIGYRYI